MAEVKPFRAVRYGERAGSLETLVAPPYDVISPAQARRARGPERAQRRPPDPARGRGRRRRRLARLARGRHAGRGQEPGYWWLSQDYVGPDGVARTREGLVAALKAEPYENRVVLPHERTHRGPKEGRLRLLREVPAQLEPLFFLYEGAPPARRPDREPDLEVEARASGGSRPRASPRRSPTASC